MARKSRLSKSKVELETYEQKRSKFPPTLVKAYLNVSNSSWEDDRLYNKFVKERGKYLKDLSEDGLECGKLTVELARATFDLKEPVRKNKNGKAKKEKEDKD